MSLQGFVMASNTLQRTSMYYNALKTHYRIPKVKKEDTKKGERVTDHKELLRKEKVIDHKSKTNLHKKSKNDILMMSTSPSELAYKSVMKKSIEQIGLPKMTCAQKTRSGKFKYDTRQLPKSKTKYKSIFKKLEEVKASTVHKDINFKKLRQQLRQRGQQ